MNRSRPEVPAFAGTTKKSIFICFLAGLVLFAAAVPAEATWHNSGRSSRSSSSKSKSSSGFIVRKCKTQACFKKHPDGHYAVPLNKKKKK
jgi:flagellar basal body-associated protein FliL